SVETRVHKPRTFSRRKISGRSAKMRKKQTRTEPYKKRLLESLKDPEEASTYLSGSLADSDARVFLLALRVAEAHGGLGRLVAHGTGLSRESLCRTLSERLQPVAG